MCYSLIDSGIEYVTQLFLVAIMTQIVFATKKEKMLLSGKNSNGCVVAHWQHIKDTVSKFATKTIGFLWK